MPSFALAADIDTLLADEAAGAPEAPQRSHGRRAVVKAVAVLAAVAGAIVALGRFGRQVAPDADGAHDVALYGQHACDACQGQQCGCDWANAETCSAKSYTADCCWSCCCAQDGIHQFSALPYQAGLPGHGVLLGHGVGIVAAPDHLHGTMDRGCSLNYGQAVHVTGNSGSSYHATITGYSGGGLYKAAIGSQEYPVRAEQISECSPANELLTFWLPLLLVCLVLCAVAYVVYKKVTTGKLPEVPASPPPSRSCCGGK